MKKKILTTAALVLVSLTPLTSNADYYLPPPTIQNSMRMIHENQQRNYERDQLRELRESNELAREQLELEKERLRDERREQSEKALLGE